MSLGKLKYWLSIASIVLLSACQASPTAEVEEDNSEETMVEADNVAFVDSNIWIVQEGEFKTNFERLAREAGYDLVVWDRRVQTCIWQQPTSFNIPEHDPKDALAFYAGTQDFYLHFSELDKHVRLEYTGPAQRLRHCD